MYHINNQNKMENTILPVMRLNPLYAVVDNYKLENGNVTLVSSEIVLPNFKLN